MEKSIRLGIIVGGFMGALALTGTAGAESGSGAEGAANKYSGASGSQAVQERMYQERLREFTEDQTQGGHQSQAVQPAQSREAHKNRPSEMESGQRMDPKSQSGGSAGQQRMKGSTTDHGQGGDRTMGQETEGRRK